MSGPLNPVAIDDGLMTFDERLRRALHHDLLSPLGTIANYAAILEHHEKTPPEEIRAFAARIRASTDRLAKMFRHLAAATELSSRSLRFIDVEPRGLLRSVLVELGLNGPPASSSERHERMPFDEELLAFAWRSYLGVQSEIRVAEALQLDLAITSTEQTTTIELFVREQPATRPERIGLSQFAPSMSPRVPAEWIFVLGLVEGLFHSRGGEFALWGHPGEAAGLRVGLPTDHVGT